MPFEDLLVERMEIRRRGAGEDRFGQKSGAFAPVAEVNCYATVPRGGQTANELYREAVRQAHNIITLPGTDVREADHVVVRTRAGQEILPEAEVTFVRHVRNPRLDTEHHVSVEAEVMRGGD